MSYNKVNQTTGNLEQIAGSQVNSVYADAPIGVIEPYGGTTAPESWLKCDGRAVSRTTYEDLFAVIGTKFGPGDGSTTFNLPSGDFGAQLYPAFEGMYIIKAIKTAVPADFEEALEVKQNITDNTLQTTSKTVPGAINELKDGKVSVSAAGIGLISGAIEHPAAGVFTLIFDINGTNKSLLQFDNQNIQNYRSEDGGATWSLVWSK